MRLRLFALPIALLFCWTIASAQDVGSEDPKERARAAKALGNQGSSGVAALQTLIKDPEYKVRLEAVKSLVKIGGQHSLDPLITATQDADAEIQIRATDGLVNFYLPGYLNTGLTASIKRVGSGIKGKFTDTNDQVIPPYMEVRPEVIEALGKLASGGSGMTSRANAARAIGILRGKAAVPDLLKALRTKDSVVLYECLIALQKIGDISAGPEVAFLLRDLDDNVQIAAIETTGLLQNREALPQLRDVLEGARNKNIRRAALTAIAMLPDEGSRGTYTRYLKDKDPLVRAAAAEGFGRLGNTEDLGILEQYFESEKKMNPRLSLAFALVKLGKTEISEFSPLQYLVNTLNSSSFHGVAQPFLVELARQPQVRENLYGSLRTGTKKEKILLASALAVSGDADTVPHLQSLTKDADPEVATEAVGALRTLRARL